MDAEQILDLQARRADIKKLLATAPEGSRYQRRLLEVLERLQADLQVLLYVFMEEGIPRRLLRFSDMRLLCLLRLRPGQQKKRTAETEE